jgi:site-specific DNA recombinase
MSGTNGQVRVAAIYARVSSERQRQEQTIQSQTVALRELAEQRELLVAEEFIFEDDGFSGASLQRPALERLRDRAFDGCFEVLLCHAPDRLARRYAYQVLLLEELARGGIEVVFAKEPERSGSPEDELLRQFQGMIAEYERAQIAERCRRGKLHRARAGAVSVLSNAPYGYRYVKKTEHADAFYEVNELEAPIVREIFDRYAMLGPVDDLGDPAQPRLHRPGGLRSTPRDRRPREADARHPRARQTFRSLSLRARRS